MINDIREMAVGWLVGYFVFMTPIIYALNGSVQDGLFHSIWGVLIAVGILVIGGKN